MRAGFQPRGRYCDEALVKEGSGLGQLPVAVSVIIPCWNSERWIGKAIKSVLDQGRSDVELIIIDDGSTDGSLEVIKGFEPKIRWRTGKNKGPCHSRNLGIDLAQGRYLIFLDADDYLSDRYLDIVIGSVSEERADMVLTSFVTIHVDQSIEMQPAPIDSHPEALLGMWLCGPHPYTSAMVFSKKFIDKIGRWNEAVKVWQDFELGLRAILADPKVILAPEAIAVYVNHDSEERVSRTKSVEAWMTAIEFLEELKPRILDDGRPELKIYLGRYFLELAIKLYRARDFVRARATVARARELGFHGNLRGTNWDSVLTSVIGLENREIIGLIKRYFLRGRKMRGAPLS